MVNRLERSRLRNGLLFALPWLIGISIFYLYPIAGTLYHSFFEYPVFSPPTFTGFLNYETLLNDELFWITVYNSIYYTCMYVPLAVIVSIFLALILNMKIRKGISFYRMVYYMPCIVPMVGASLLWMWIFNAHFGLLNTFLRMIGINGPGWLASATWSKPSLVLMALWLLGPGIIIYLSALQDVPQQLHDVAEIDGANWVQRLRYITLPMLTPIILFDIIISLTLALQTFTRIYIMTRGGPANSTLLFGLYIYRTAFAYLNMGYACALAWVFFILVFIVTILIFKSSAKWVYYGGEG
ncbi:ABC transporter permease [Candidatus Aerophobetes bacterium Ae_b3a]|nr:MAG: ABC transporter permease [Candidatus Aerophobetes bacterium Ae_b3a]